MKTKKLFEEDAYRKEFDGAVLACREEQGTFLVCLDQTCFYPEGGGQPWDLGTLNGAAVRAVRAEGECIWHETERAFSPGETVHGSIDWSRRFDLMQQHSGEHIVSGLIHQKYGLDNVGFHLTEESLTIDLNGELNGEQLREIEQAANERIWENAQTQIWIPEERERAALTYRSKKALTGAVRLVRFPGSDCCACCGTHVRRTGEIGAIRVLSCQRHKDGIRVELRCGGRALAYDRACAEQNHRISVCLSSPETRTAEAVQRLREERDAARRQLAEYIERGFAGRAASLAGAGDVLLFEEDLTPDLLPKLAAAVMEQCGGVCAVFSGNDREGYKYAAGKKGGDIRAWIRELNRELNGRGGGKPFFAQGSVQADRKAIEHFFKGGAE
jgi:alanyl-tRNA synthetase